MALDITHLRFALDVRDEYHVTDFSRYLSGAIYPDSRYATGVARELTHPSDFDRIPLPKEDDFRKGWETHLVYDEIQMSVIVTIPGMIAGPISQGNDAWRRVTAVKLLQAAFDFPSVECAAVCPSLCAIETPFGESLEVMERYYSGIRRRYSGKKNVDSAIFEQVLRDLGDEGDLTVDVLKRIQHIQEDEGIMNAISGIYDETMRIYRERYR